MSIEERLTRALEEEADQIEVDVVRLLGVTRGRLTTKLDVRRRRTGRSVLAAAAVAVIATGAAGVSLLTGDDDPTSTPGTDSGAVSDDFTCPAQHTIDFATDDQDEFLASELDELGGPRKFAEEYDAPRYEFVASRRPGDPPPRERRRIIGQHHDLPQGRRRLGTRHRAGVHRRRRQPGRSDGRRAEARPARESSHGRATKMLSGDEIRTGVFIDDRPTYNYAGIIDTHRSIWVTPCGNRMCWNSGRPDSSVFAHWPPDDGPAVRDVSGIFFLPDDMVGRVNPYGMWSVYDRQGAVESLFGHAARRDSADRPAIHKSGLGRSRVVRRPGSVVGRAVRRPRRDRRGHLSSAPRGGSWLRAPLTAESALRFPPSRRLGPAESAPRSRRVGA